MDGTVVYKLCDVKPELIDAWNEQFVNYYDQVQVHKGDIFQDGPAADAIVSPANSFGFMDGGIDAVYTKHFGKQLSERLQHIIQDEYDGELLVGQAIVLPIFENHVVPSDLTAEWRSCNDGQPIRYLISAPTMRVPLDVQETVNSYLAFRAVILSVQKHNKTHPEDPIRTVLCPGLGTAVGRMPAKRCAYQMRRAYEIFELGKHKKLLHPTHLMYMHYDHETMSEYPMLN
ncbi:uncharacterized protein LOC141913634 [Tubulanus polymorphus]|uniref:uncharacterized protein LOC141913634 n=1 Tax=Tubulanus polymorphus TaxID=672921 RepID=UPI003DA2D19E